MDDVEAMRVVQGVEHLRENANLFFKRQRLGLEDLRKVLALQVLHGDEDHAVDLAGFKDGDDVRVREARARLRLAHHALEVLGPIDIRPHRFDGDGALQRGIEGLVDLAHAAAAKHFLNLETAYRLRQRRVWTSHGVYLFRPASAS